MVKNHGTNPKAVREARSRAAEIERAEKAEDRRGRPRLAFRDDSLEVFLGDVREVLPGIPSESVDAVVTSPPYWRQRAYLPDGDPDAGSELGREATFDEWVANLVGIASELARILRPTGSLWINVGDRYCAYGGEHVADPRRHDWSTIGRHAVPAARARLDGYPEGVRRKSLLLAPYRLAIALCDAGWILRDRIVWEKTNALPESARDRALRRRMDPAKPSSIERAGRAAGRQRKLGVGAASRRADGTDRLEARQGSIVDLDAGVFRYTGRNEQRTRVNPGNVWPIPTASREGAAFQHFAMFPEELVVRPILSTVPPGGTVLDPFAGTGTVGAVANRLGRRAILVELDRRRLDDIVDRTVRRLDLELLGLGPAETPREPDPGLFDGETVG